jgi:hypothetical protein
MKNKRKKAQRPLQAIQVWTHAQALRALPYITSIMRSLRDHRLQFQQHQLRAQRLASRPGHRDRTTILAQEEATQEAQRCADAFNGAFEEMLELDVYCLDPVRGLALIPFAHENQLAWFIFDLFDNVPLRTWRYHEDALDMRRPIAEVLKEPLPDTRIA